MRKHISSSPSAIFYRGLCTIWATTSIKKASTQQHRVEAVHQAPSPKNVTELHSFLGLVNYYVKFLPKYLLLRPKRQLSEASVLVQCHPKLLLRLVADPSNYFVGVLPRLWYYNSRAGIGQLDFVNGPNISPPI